MVNIHWQAGDPPKYFKQEIDLQKVQDSAGMLVNTRGYLKKIVTDI